MSRFLVEAIEVRDLSFSYPMATGPLLALDNVNFELQQGEIVCLQGASGSGKSTLLSCIAGLELPDAGSIRIAGQELVGMSPRQRTELRLNTVGLVFQDHNLVSQFTARENIEIVLRCQGRANPRDEAEDLLELVGIRELSDRLPTNMSGGQRQRVGIARALAGQRPFLLCDEPTGALDSTNSQSLFGHLRTLAHDHGIGCLVATHDPIARDFGDTIIEMLDGRVQ